MPGLPWSTKCGLCVAFFFSGVQHSNFGTRAGEEAWRSLNQLFWYHRKRFYDSLRLNHNELTNLW